MASVVQLPSHAARCAAPATPCTTHPRTRAACTEDKGTSVNVEAPGTTVASSNQGTTVQVGWGMRRACVPLRSRVHYATACCRQRA